MIFDARTVQSTPESGAGAGYDGYKRRQERKTHEATDTLGHLLALRVTSANEQERDRVAQPAEAVQEVTGETVEDAERGFVVLPGRWVIERSSAWAARFRRLARDYERLPETVAGLHFVAFACLQSLAHRRRAYSITGSR